MKWKIAVGVVGIISFASMASAEVSESPPDPVAPDAPAQAAVSGSGGPAVAAPPALPSPAPTPGQPEAKAQEVPSPTLAPQLPVSNAPQNSQAVDEQIAHHEPHLKLGVELGMNFGTLNYTPAYGYSEGYPTYTFATAGGYIEIPVNENLAIQPGLYYVPKYVNMRFITLPLLAKGMLPIAHSPAKLFAVAGPDFGFKVQDPTFGQLNPVDIAIDFGAGVEIAVAPNTSLVLETRYSVGLTNLLSNYQNPYYGYPYGGTESTLNTRGLYLIGGVSFGF